MEICKICRKEFKSLKSLAQHLAKPEIKQNHNISSTKDYYDVFIKSSNEGICKLDGCNNSAGYIGLKLGYLKYCCHKHGQISKEIKTLRSENNKKSWKDPISGHNSIKCRLKMRESKRQNWKEPSSWYNSEECRDGRKETARKMVENKTGMFSEETREKNYANLLERCKDPNYFTRTREFNLKVAPKRRKWMKEGGAAYINSFNKSQSKPQKHIFNNVLKLFPNYIIKIDYPFLNYNLDIAILEPKIVLEYDGAYWHKDSSEKDLKRQEECEKYGWKFIRYKGTMKKDFYPTLEQVKEDIQKVLNFKEI